MCASLMVFVKHVQNCIQCFNQFFFFAEVAHVESCRKSNVSFLLFYIFRSLHDDAFPLGLTQIPLENGVSSDGNYDFPIQSSSSTSPGDRSTSSSESDTAPRTGYDPTGQGQMIHSHGVLGGPHLEHMSQQEKFQLQQTLPQQQQQQPQHQQQRRHLSLTDCQQNHQSGCMHQQHYPQHHHRHHPHHNQQQHETYFSQSGQPEIEYDSYEQSAIGQP